MSAEKWHPFPGRLLWLWRSSQRNRQGRVAGSCWQKHCLSVYLTVSIFIAANAPYDRDKYPSLFGLLTTYPGHSMKNTWSSNYEAYTWPPRHISVHARGIATCLLVTESNKPDSQVDRLFCDLNHGDSYQTEDDRHSQIAERPGDYLGSAYRRHFRCMKETASESSASGLEQS